MASKAQEDFFNTLLNDRDFGSADTTALASQFMQLGQKSASEWIEKAIGLPKLDQSGEQRVPPPF